MCSKTETLEYIEGSSRYDKKTHEMLAKFLKTGKISTFFTPINKYYRNICYLNTTRIKINKECCDRFVFDKEYKSVDFKYNGKTEKYKVCIGMPLIATQNIKIKEIFNTMEFTIGNITDDGFEIHNELFSDSEFGETFIPSFCLTVYKYQGGTINEHYNIYDVNRMDKKQLYSDE